MVVENAADSLGIRHKYMISNRLRADEKIPGNPYDGKKISGIDLNTKWIIFCLRW